eukprot:10760377-Prorocentrum_lima.AAC.1
MQRQTGVAREQRLQSEQAAKAVLQKIDPLTMEDIVLCQWGQLPNAGRRHIMAMGQSFVYSD